MKPTKKPKTWSDSNLSICFRGRNPVRMQVYIKNYKDVFGSPADARIFAICLADNVLVSHNDKVFLAEMFREYLKIMEPTK